MTLDTDTTTQGLYWHKSKALESEAISKAVCERLNLSLEELRQLSKATEEGKIN
jgi:hypothetical protein